VISPKYGRFDATIQAADYRTSATLLQLEGANLPVAETGSDIAMPEAKEQVYVCGWDGDEQIKAPLNAAYYEKVAPLFFPVALRQETIGSDWNVSGETGSPIVDDEGRVIGLLGNYWSKLLIHLGGPLDHYPELAVSIDSALGLLNDSSYTHGLAKAVFFAHGFNNDIVPGPSPHTPINTLEGMGSAVEELLGQLGTPLPFDDMTKVPLLFREGDGIMLTVAFTFPVELRSSDGSLLAEAKWVGIQWDRDEDKPDRLLYGSSTYIVKGAVSIDEDMGELLRVLQPAIDELP